MEDITYEDCRRYLERMAIGSSMRYKDMRLKKRKTSFYLHSPFRPARKLSPKQAVRWFFNKNSLHSEVVYTKKAANSSG